MTWTTVRGGKRQSWMHQESCWYLDNFFGDAVGVDSGEIEWITGQILPVAGITRFARNSRMSAPAPSCPDSFTIQSDDYLMTALN